MDDSAHVAYILWINVCRFRPRIIVNGFRTLVQIQRTGHIIKMGNVACNVGWSRCTCWNFSGRGIWFSFRTLGRVWSIVTWGWTTSFNFVVDRNHQCSRINIWSSNHDSQSVNVLRSYSFRMGFPFTYSQLCKKERQRCIDLRSYSQHVHVVRSFWSYDGSNRFWIWCHEYVF